MSFMLDFQKSPVLGILRGVNAGIIEPLVDTVISSGLKYLEVTMNTAGAPDLIKIAKAASKGKLAIGAGTVLNLGSMRLALDAGAEFIVTPVLVNDVVGYCAANKIPVFPGALTPAEIYSAWNAGASMVKVFPSNFFGPSYFSAVKGPFDNIKLLACGGVTPENMADYMKNGADAVAIGGSVFKKEFIEKKDFGSIKTAIEKYLKNITCK